MESNEREIICYRLLNDVFVDNAFASIQLNSCLSKIDDERDKAYISNLFYGVLEKNVEFNYIVQKLTSKKPKANIDLIIKIGLYMMRYMSTPTYAAINKTVELTKAVGKGGVSGFVNAVLRKSETVKLPQEGEVEDSIYLSITYSVPKWICEKLISQYGYEFVKAFLSYEPVKKTHIRYNSNVTTKEEFEEKLQNFDYIPTKLGYYVTHNMQKTLEKSIYTAQSLASMVAVHCYLPTDLNAPMVLDLCGAPGGKSIYLKELCPSANVICCDVHPHRVELIKKYAKRMKSDIKAVLSDACSIIPEWINKCDIVICDVPCSGIGVYKNKPDILFNKTLSDLQKITALQMNILENAKNYVKVGGVLCYSTCTIFKEENDDIINNFLNKNPDFELDKIESPVAPENNGIVKLFPHIDNSGDGFFVARMRRRK